MELWAEIRRRVLVEGVSIRQVCREQNMSHHTVSKMLQALEKSGAIVRRPDPEDQRLTRVALTPAGREIEGEMRTVAAGYVNATIGTLPEADRRELARLLEELGASIERAGVVREAGREAGDSGAAEAPR